MVMAEVKERKEKHWHTIYFCLILMAEASLIFRVRVRVLQASSCIVFTYSKRGESVCKIQPLTMRWSPMAGGSTP